MILQTYSFQASFTIRYPPDSTRNGFQANIFKAFSENFSDGFNIY